MDVGGYRIRAALAGFLVLLAPLVALGQQTDLAKQSPYYAIGDSIAVQLKTIGMPGTAIGGKDPRYILGMIQGIPAGTLNSKTVVLSSGASNTGTSMSNLGDPNVVRQYVPAQIRAIKQAGASGVILLGVGPKVNGDMNNVLQQIAQQEGVKFSPLTKTNDGVHPSSPKDLLASLGGAVTPSGTQTAQAPAGPGAVSGPSQPAPQQTPILQTPPYSYQQPPFMSSLGGLQQPPPPPPPQMPQSLPASQNINPFFTQPQQSTAQTIDSIGSLSTQPLLLATDTVSQVVDIANTNTNVNTNNTDSDVTLISLGEEASLQPERQSTKDSGATTQPKLMRVITATFQQPAPLPGIPTDNTPLSPGQQRASFQDSSLMNALANIFAGVKQLLLGILQQSR